MTNCCDLLICIAMFILGPLSISTSASVSWFVVVSICIQCLRISVDVVVIKGISSESGALEGINR